MKIFHTGPAGSAEEFVTRAASVLIGRQLPLRPDSLGLDDGKVSARHARLSFKGGEYWIEDLGSTNGTWVDQRKISPHEKIRLATTSVILVGQTTLRLEAPAVAGPSSASAVDPAFPAPGQSLVHSVEAGQPLSELYRAGSSSIDAAETRLREVCELSTALGEIDGGESLATTVLDHLQRAFPEAGRGAHFGVLLGEDFVLKGFRPDDEPPTCSLTLARYVVAQKTAHLWEISAPQTVEKSASIIRGGVQSAMYAPLVWKGEVLGVLYMDATSPKASFGADDLRLLQAIATHAAMSLKSSILQQTLLREETVKTRLLAQFPRAIAERLARQPGRLAISSERIETATVMFSDVRGFTGLTAKLEPEEAVQMLNDMFQELTPIVLKYDGTVDKYIGDAILAVFGSPDPDARQWEHAVRAALDMQAAIKRLGAGVWKGKTPFEVGIGIHTGPVIHGFIGAPERMDYTVIGSTINQASRICNGAGPGEILISPAAYGRLHDVVDVDLPPREFETKHEGPMKAYRVIRWRGRPKVK